MVGLLGGVGGVGVLIFICQLLPEALQIFLGEDVLETGLTGKLYDGCCGELLAFMMIYNIRLSRGESNAVKKSACLRSQIAWINYWDDASLLFAQCLHNFTGLDFCLDL